jgi:MYXO-CTERM domain-containing protein
MLRSIVVLLMTLTFAATAWADVAPGPGYVEDCTVGKKEQAGTTCEECASGRDREGECEEFYADTDFEYACQTSGATVWTEVWCDGPPRPGCSLSPEAAASPAVAFALATLALLLIRRRR